MFVLLWMWSKILLILMDILEPILSLFFKVQYVIEELKYGRKIFRQELERACRRGDFQVAVEGGVGVVWD